MSEMQKAAAGLLYDANYDEELIRFRDHAKPVLFDFNHTPPRQAEKRKDLLKSLLGKTGENFLIEADVAPRFYPVLSSFPALVKCFPFLDQRELEFSGVKAHADEDVGEPFMSEIGGLLPIALCGRTSL